MKSGLIRFLTFAAVMGSVTFMPIYARELGILDSEIGVVVAFHSLALFLSSFIFGRASDQYGRRLFLIVGLILASVAFFLQIFAQDFWSLLGIRILVGFSLGVFPASLIAYVHESGKDLSRFSSFGSLGWALGVLIAGSIAASFAIKWVFILNASFLFLAVLVALSIKFGEKVSLDLPKFPTRIIRKNLFLYLAILIRHSGAHMIWTFWPLFLLSLGANLFWVGVIQTINAATQFVFMFVLSGKIKYVVSTALGLLMSGITFFSFTFASNFWQIIPTQIILGVSWALMYVGGLRFLMDRNIEKATVSGLFDSVLSLSSIIGPFLAAIVIALDGYRSIMYLASFLAFVSFLLFWISEKGRRGFSYSLINEGF